MKLTVHPAFTSMASNFSDMHCFMPLIRQYAADICSRKINATIVELGVRGGNSTISLLDGIDAADNGGHLHSCDIAASVGALTAIPEDLARNWRYQRCDSVEFADQFDPHSVQLLLIDTDHSYELTIAELYAWVTRMDFGGTVLLHDTCSCTGVGRAIAEFLAAYTKATYYNIPVYAGLGVIKMP